jgi:outer membrane receptor for ferrienterochelin and colicins
VKRLWAVLIFIVFGDFGARAADDKSVSELKAMDLNELLRVDIPTVFGASKHEQRITEAPSSVSIVTKEDIKLQGYRTLQDLLQGVRGFYVTSDRDYGHIGVRGVNRPGDWGGRVLIAVDGHRLNEPLYDSAFNQSDFILDLDLVERVEVIRGPGSALYGNNAFFAVINVVTRSGADMKGAEVSGAYGSFDAETGRISYGNRFKNGVEFLLSGTYFGSEGHDRLYYDEYAAINNGLAQKSDYENAKNAFLKASYMDFSLEAAWVDRDKHVPSAPLGSQFADGRYRTMDEREYVDLRYQHQFENELTLMARVYQDYYRFDAVYPFDYQDPLNPGITLNNDYGRADWVGTEWQLTKVLLDQHRVTGGVEYRRDISITQKNYDVAPPAIYVDSKNSGDIVGVYLQDEYSIRTNLVLNAGARYDYFSAFGSTINPRAALIYSPVDETTLKLIYGQAYRAPNDFENSYNATGYKHVGTLDPESVRSYEIVYEQGLPGRLRLTVSGFYEQIQDLIVNDTDAADGKIFWRNLDSVDTRGFEAELEGHWNSGIRARASYTLAHAQDNQRKQRLSNSPLHMLKAQITAPVWPEKVFLSLEALGTSERYTARRGTAGAYAVLNATLFSRHLFKGLEASVSIYNLLDRSYGDVVSEDFLQEVIPQDGRSFRLKLTYSF